MMRTGLRTTARAARAAASWVVVLAWVVTACASGANIYSPAFRSADGTAIWLTIGACNAELTAHVDERADRVMVRVGARNGYDGDCAGGISIHLSEPLGDRPLIDASDSDEIEVRYDEARAELLRSGSSAPHEAVPVGADALSTDALVAVADLEPADQLFEMPAGDGGSVFVRVRDGQPTLLFGTSCDVVSSTPLPVGWEGVCLEYTSQGQRIAGEFPWGTTSAGG